MVRNNFEQSGKMIIKDGLFLGKCDYLKWDIPRWKWLSKYEDAVADTRAIKI